MFYFFYRAESAHAKLKRHLGSSQGDFKSSWNVINALIELQHTEIKASFERSISIVEHQFNNAVFKELRGMVSRASLNMILMEFKRATQVEIEKGICGCMNRTSYGLPCAHELTELIKEGRTIPLDSVHSHWRNLVHELHTFHDEYVQLYGSIDRVAELVYSLSCFDSFAPYDRWMTLPDMCHLIASRYNIVLVH